MTAKEKLLERARSWSEHEAEVALRAVESRHAGEGQRDADEWGDVSAFRRASSASVFKHLDEEEAKTGFSWEQHR